MTFEQYWSNVSHLEQKVNGNIIRDMSAATWDVCKKEVVTILKDHFSRKNVIVTKQELADLIDQIEKL